MKRIETRMQMLSVPAANDWQPFAEAIKNRQGPARHNSPVKVEVDVVGEYLPYFKVNEDLVNKLIFDPVFGLDAPLIIRIGNYKNVSVQWRRPQRGKEYRIYLFQYQTPKNANYIFIHELQHLYQYMEEREFENAPRERTTDWLETQKIHQRREQEIDANAMAQKLVESGIQFIEPQTEEYFNSLPPDIQELSTNNMKLIQNGDPNNPGRFPSEDYWSEVGQQATQTLGIG